jgi:hypothetical protein
MSKTTVTPIDHSQEVQKRLANAEAMRKNVIANGGYGSSNEDFMDSQRGVVESYNNIYNAGLVVDEEINKWLKKRTKTATGS